MVKKLTKHTLFIVLLLIAIVMVGCFGGGGGGAKTYKLTVKVLDADDDSPISDAKVVVEKKVTKTGKDGIAVISNLSGMVSIEVTAEGYDSKVKSDISITKDLTETIKLKLSDPSGTSAAIGRLEWIKEDGTEIRIDDTNYNVYSNEALRRYFAQLDLDVLGIIIAAELRDGEIFKIERFDFENKEYVSSTLSTLVNPDYGDGVTSPVRGIEFMADTGTKLGSSRHNEIKLAMDDAKILGYAQIFASLEVTGSRVHMEATKLNGSLLVDNFETNIDIDEITEDVTLSAPDYTLRTGTIAGDVFAEDRGKLSGGTILGSVFINADVEFVDSTVKNKVIVDGENSILERIIGEDHLTILADNVTVANSEFAGISANEGKYATLENVLFLSLPSSLTKNLTENNEITDGDYFDLDLEGWHVRDILLSDKELEFKISNNNIVISDVELPKSLWVVGKDFILNDAIVSGRAEFSQSADNATFNDVIFKGMVSFDVGSPAIPPTFNGGVVEFAFSSFPVKGYFNGVTFERAAHLNTLVNLDGVIFKDDVTIGWNFDAKSNYLGGIIEGDLRVMLDRARGTINLEGVTLHGNVTVDGNVMLRLENVIIDPKAQVRVESAPNNWDKLGYIYLIDVTVIDNGHLVEVDSFNNLTIGRALDGANVVSIQNIKDYDYIQQPIISNVTMEDEFNLTTWGAHATFINSKFIEEVTISSQNNVFIGNEFEKAVYIKGDTILTDNVHKDDLIIKQSGITLENPIFNKDKIEEYDYQNLVVGKNLIIDGLTILGDTDSFFRVLVEKDQEVEFRGMVDFSKINSGTFYLDGRAEGTSYVNNATWNPSFDEVVK